MKAYQHILAALALVTCSRAVVAGAESPAPKVAISINGSAEAKVFRGMPLLVSVTLVNPLSSRIDAPPIIIASERGAWTSAVHIEIIDETGAAQQWPLNTQILPGPTITLDHSKYARFDQWLAPNQTLNLSTGIYSVRVTLDTTRATDETVWKGVVDPAPATVEIADEPATLSEEDMENKHSQLAQYELFQMNGAAALQHADQLLTPFPANLAGMRIKALALNSLGRVAEAYDVTAQAIEMFSAPTNVTPEPPVNLLTLQNELEQSLRKPILRLNVTPNQQTTVDWPGHPSLSYRLESSTDFTLWSTFATNFNIVNDIYTLALPASTDHKFFRLSIGNTP